MDAQFSFDVDRSRCLVRISMSGLFTPADIEAFLAARRKAHAALGCAPNSHMTLNDVRGMKIQHQNVVEAFRNMLSAPEYKSRRLAFVISPSLTMSQLMRAFASRDARCFETISEAEHWLFADQAEQSLRRTATR